MSTFTSGTATAVKITFQGTDTAGPIPVPGLLPGDVIVAIDRTGFTAGFEFVISVADEIQKLSPLDWTSVLFTVYLMRGV